MIEYFRLGFLIEVSDLIKSRIAVFKTNNLQLKVTSVFADREMCRFVGNFGGTHREFWL